MKLVIVESPTKAKTIAKFLGGEYKIESSFGHIRDLPKSNLGVDTENEFEPAYEVPAKAKKTVSNLKSYASKADEVILASDEDREGEAIAWHLAQVLKLPAKKTKRIVFHEITKNAILEALEHPRGIDENLVDAQQARRVVDRLVGYELSPFLWRKVARGLSAGRVQSVAVRMIVEREREIQKFIKEEYWTIVADLAKKNDKEKFVARLFKINGKSVGKLEIKNEKMARKIETDLQDAHYIVAAVEKKETKKNPLPPFTTSTLQQSANRFFKFSAKQTMMLAQQLYEGVEIKAEGHIGLITYMRTDSLNLSKSFLDEARDYLAQNYGDKYAVAAPRFFKSKSKGAQEAHEAIRPTDVSRNPDAIKNSLTPAQYKLYKLIWQRALASQMPQSVFDSMAVDIEASGTPYLFRASGQSLKFDGYLKVYPEKFSDENLPALISQDELDLLKLNTDQHWTEPPARYNDAGLVKELEKHGIGRPSTYAPTISTVIARKYVERDDNKRLFPTDIAFVVNDLLTEHFADVVGYEFTADLEENFDNIAEGAKKWRDVVGKFYFPFKENLKDKTKNLTKKDIMPEEKTDEKCDKCGKGMVIKIGRFGKFLSCSGFPECKNAKPLPGTDKDHDGKADNSQIDELQKKFHGIKCEKCDSPMAPKVGKYGPFLACTAFPKCRNLKSLTDDNSATGVKCPSCGKGEIVQKRSKRGIFFACNQYPACKTAFNSKPTGEKCKKCGGVMVETNTSPKCSNRECE